MNKQISLSTLSDELTQVRTKKKEFLEQIERIVPWGEWLSLIKPCYYKGERGNKPYDLELMLRIYLIQNLYDLADEATVNEVIDSRAFSDFCGVESSNQVPDGDTLGRFRNLLNEPYPAGDYLYYSGGIDDLWLGLWGIIRAYSTPQEKLLPLCGYRPICPPMTPPKGAVVRKFEVAAIQRNIKYNRYGDHDPEGLIFVPLEQAKDVMSGRKEPIPLILRANAGDWIEVTLHNLFDPKVPII